MPNSEAGMAYHQADEERIDAIVDAVHDFIQWMRDRPFGAPSSVEDYRKHLTVQSIVERVERGQGAQGEG